MRASAFPYQKILSGRTVLNRAGLITCLCLVSTILVAQPLPDSTSLRSKLQATQSLLGQSKAQQVALPDLRVLNRQLDIQEQLLEVLTRDLTEYQNELEALQENMCLIEEGIDRLRQEYIATVRQTYRDFHPRSFWLSLLSSGSLTEAYYRSQYFREYSRYRKEQILLMQESKALLQTQLKRFERVWRRRGRLAQSRRSELARLRANRKLQKSLSLSLRNKATQLRQDYHSQQQALQHMIADTENPSVVLVNDSLVAEADLGEQFSRSIGQLQWPVPPTQSIIVETFGVAAITTVFTRLFETRYQRLFLCRVCVEQGIASRSYR
jgi:peptidoglycan hydrolase CwlO-like protein